MAETRLRLPVEEDEKKPLTGNKNKLTFKKLAAAGAGVVKKTGMALLNGCISGGPGDAITMGTTSTLFGLHTACKQLKNDPAENQPRDYDPVSEAPGSQQMEERQEIRSSYGSVNRKS